MPFMHRIVYGMHNTITSLKSTSFDTPQIFLLVRFDWSQVSDCICIMNIDLHFLCFFL